VEHSIGLSLISDAAGWKVAGIIPGSPAERAHLAVGELVTRIEGRPACDWSRDQIGRWIDSHDSVSLALTGPSGRRDLTLRVWALVP
jgi:C-terminal processing protease CtpA/Prc